MVAFFSIVLNVILIYSLYKLLSSHTDIKRDSDLKTHYFHQLSDHVWDHAVFMDSNGAVAAPGGEENKEILSHWNKYHAITENFKSIGKS